MSIYRCAACGSSHVVADTKKEGYSIGKGVAGTVLLGPAGAVAGVNGKKILYYHCAACGQTLSYSMPVSQKNLIDSYLEKPDEYSDKLKSLKSQYPNIEYDSASRPRDQKTNEELADDIYEYYLKTKNYEITYSELAKEVLGSENASKINAVIEILKSRGRILTGQRDTGENFCLFFSETSEIELNAGDYLIKNNKEELLALFTLNMKGQTSLISLTEAEVLLSSEIIKHGYTQDVVVSKYVARKIIHEAYSKAIIKFEDQEDSNQRYVRLISKDEVDAQKEVLEKEKEEKRERLKKQIEEQKRNKEEANNHLKQVIFSVLAGDEKKTIMDMQKADQELGGMSNQRLGGFVRILAASGELGCIEEGKKVYYMMPETADKIKKEEAKRQEEMKQKEAARKAEAERKEAERLKEKAKHNAEIDKKINALESDVNKWDKVYLENKGKVFGSGAKTKKEALQKLEELRKEIALLQSKKL